MSFCTAKFSAAPNNRCQRMNNNQTRHPCYLLYTNCILYLITIHLLIMFINYCTMFCTAVYVVCTVEDPSQSSNYLISESFFHLKGHSFLLHSLPKRSLELQESLVISTKKLTTPLLLVTPLQQKVKSKSGHHNWQWAVVGGKIVAVKQVAVVVVRD